MNETDEKLERLAIRYWTMASIPAGARKGVGGGDAGRRVQPGGDVQLTTDRKSVV